MSDKISRYNCNFRSKYCYKNTDILINKFNIRESQKLLSIEADLSYLRLIELYKKPIDGCYDIDHLLKIHNYLFRDIYEFSGNIRDEDISKGNTIFCKSKFIHTNLINTFDWLKSENYLIDLQKNKFIKESAYLLSELNIIHPFIEGNGRTIREFFRELCINCDFKVNWHQSNKSTILAAFISSASGNLTQLESLLFHITSGS